MKIKNTKKNTLTFFIAYIISISQTKIKIPSHLKEILYLTNSLYKLFILEYH